MANRDNLDSGLTGGAGSGAEDWASQDAYWRSNFTSRPYVSGDRGYEAYQPGYRYGFESVSRFRGRSWSDVEPDLRSGWERYEHRGESTWDGIKDAVRDAWNVATGGEIDTRTGRNTTRPTD